MTIGELIHNKRVQKEMTLEDVGRAVGVSRATVSRWETGDIQRMKLPNIKALAALLDIDPVLLVQQEEILTMDERALVAAYRAAKPEYQAVVMEILTNHKKED